MKKRTYSQTSKYDVNQKLIHELTHLESRHILFSIIKRARITEDISKMTRIPLSTVYLKLQSLENLSLIYVKENILENGHNVKYYQSRVKGIKISISKQEPQINLIKNDN